MFAAFNSLKPNGNYMSHMLQQSITSFCIYGFCMIYLNSVNQLIFVMVKSCVFFAVRTEFLDIIQTELRL
jgi:MFS superfamily sulfate permease-like transporter